MEIMNAMEKSEHRLFYNDHGLPPTMGNERFDGAVAPNNFQINAHGLPPTTNNESLDMPLAINSFRIKAIPSFFDRRWLIFICLIPLFILSGPFSALAFSVTAQVDRNQITINDTLVLKIIFEDGEDEVDTSALADFEILSRSSSSNISIINGKYSKTITAHYRLAPRKEGRLSIPSFEVRHKGKVYTTKPITIQVVPADARPKASKDIFIEAGLSSTSLYVGQQVVYQLRLFSAIRFSNATLQQPDFSGFTAKEVGDRQNTQTTINGRAYRVIAVNYVLIPEATGEIEIDPAIITCDVPVKGRRSSDPFDDPFFSNNFFSFGRSEKRRFSTGPLSVKVDPLPQYTESPSPFFRGCRRGDHECRAGQG